MKKLVLVPIKKLLELGVIKEHVEDLIASRVHQAVMEEKAWKDIEEGRATEVDFYYDDPYYAIRNNRGNGLGNGGVSVKDLAAKCKLPRTVLEASGLSLDEIQESVVTEADKWARLSGVTESFHVSRNMQLSDLLYMQDAAVFKRHRDPHVASVVKNITNYVIGRGVVVKAADSQVHEIVRKFQHLNNWSMWQRDFVADAYTEGEYFAALFGSMRTGRAKIRRFYNKEIVETETHEDDLTTPLAYRRVRNIFDMSGGSGQIVEGSWWPDVNYFYQIDDEIDGQTSKHHDELERDTGVLHVKYGSEQRGRLPLEPSLKYVKLYEDWLNDRAMLNHERCKVLFVKTVKGRGGDATTRYQRPPRGAITLVANENVEWNILESKIAAGDAKDDGLSILYMAGSGVSLPIHILDQRADQEVYASIKKAETPFSNEIAAQQEFFRFWLTEMFRWVIRKNIEAGNLKKRTTVKRFTLESQFDAMDSFLASIAKGNTYQDTLKEATDALGSPDEMEDAEIPTEDVPINFTFPDIVREDPLTLAREIFLLNKTGLFSRTFLAGLRGVDYMEQQFYRQVEPRPVDVPGAGDGFPGGGSDDGTGEPADDGMATDEPGTMKGTDPARDDNLTVS